MPVSIAFKSKASNVQAATKTSDYVLTRNDFAICADCTNNPITLTIGANNSGWYRIKKFDITANVVTITTSNNKLIEGTPTLVIATKGNSVDLMVDELGNWWIF